MTALKPLSRMLTVLAFLPARLHEKQSATVCFWTPRCVFFEDGGIALISIRFHDNIKMICSHWRLFGSYLIGLIISSHESIHGSGDI